MNQNSNFSTFCGLQHPSIYNMFMNEVDWQNLHLSKIFSSRKWNNRQTIEYDLDTVLNVCLYFRYFYIFRCWSLVFYLYEGGLQADVGHQSEELQCLCGFRLLWGSQQKHSGHLNSAGVPAGNGRFVLRRIFFGVFCPT